MTDLPIESTTVFELSISKDTVDSIRLRKRSTRVSPLTIDWELKEAPSSNIDLDVDALDTEFRQLTLEAEKNLHELRNDPKNAALRKALTSSTKRMSRLKEWSSLVKTTEGVEILKKGMREKRQVDINKRKYEIDEVLKVVKAQSAADVCFMMDCTGSMSNYINAVKTQIHQLTDSIVQLFSTKVNLGFIGYRDIDETFERLDFTNDTNIFQAYLNTVNATGGGDTCEDVFSGLEFVSELSWSNPNRLLIHICDAPCHGQNYHDLQGISEDKYSKGDPKNRELSKLLLDIKRLGIIYCSIQLNDTTKKMFEEFSFVFGPISEIHVDDPACLIKRISQETSAVIMSSIESTMSSFRTADHLPKNYMMFGKEPDWNTMKTLTVDSIEILTPNGLEDLFRPLLVGTGSGHMKIAPYPFAKGSLRFAFYGQFSSDEFPLLDVVYKEFISADPAANTLAFYKQHLEIQVIAQF